MSSSVGTLNVVGPVLVAIVGKLSMMAWLLVKGAKSLEMATSKLPGMNGPR